MRKRKLFLHGKTMSLLALCAGVLVFVSCAEDGFDDESFTSTVKNQPHLASPAAEDITITKSADGASQTISWPLIKGALGYQLTVTDVTDLENETLLVDTLVDGTSIKIEREEDRNYVLTLLTKGNPKMNNGDAEAATKYDFTTFSPRFAEISETTDLVEYFNANPLPEEPTGEDLIFDLVPGKEYTLNDVINFNGQTVTFRTPSTSKAKIVYGEKGRFITSSGLTIKNINIDASMQTGNDAAIINLSSTPYEEYVGIYSGSQNYCDILESSPIVLTGCDIEGVNGYVIYDNSKKYCIGIMLIQNCNIHFTTSANISGIEGKALFNMYCGFINSLTIRNTTMWNTGDSQTKYIVQYSNAGRCDRGGYARNYVTVENVTMYNLACENGQFGNYSGFAGKQTSTFIMRNCIFVNTAGGQIARRFIGGNYNTNMDMNFANNTYWYKGEADSSAENYDKSGTIITEDPRLKDPDNGDFTPQGAIQIERCTGDPRWLK